MALVLLAAGVAFYIGIGRLGLSMAPSLLLVLCTVPLYLVGTVALNALRKRRIAVGSLSAVARAAVGRLLRRVLHPADRGARGLLRCAHERLRRDPLRLLPRRVRHRLGGRLSHGLLPHAAHGGDRHADDHPRRLSAGLLDRALRAAEAQGDLRRPRCILPFWTSFLVRTLLVPDHPLAEFFRSGLARSRCTSPTARSHLHNTTAAVQIGLVYNYLPLFVLPLYATLERMDWRLVDAAHRPRRIAVDGVPPDHAAADGARAAHGHAARVHPDDGRVRDPADARRRPRRLHRQRDPARSFLEAQDYAFGSALAMLVMGALSVFLAALPVPQPAHRGGIRCVGCSSTLGAFACAALSSSPADPGVAHAHRRARAAAT